MNKRKRLSRTCFNPFKDTPCQNKSTTDLRVFPQKDIWKFPEADETCVLCSVCRKRVSQYEPPVKNDNILTQVSVESLSLSQQSSSTPSGTLSNFSGLLKDYNDHSLETFLNVSPVNKRRVERVAYQTHKLGEIYAAVNAKFLSQFGMLPETTSDKLIRDHNSMLANLKHIYDTEKDKSVRLKLLSILPDSWNCNKIKFEFNCSRFTVLAARKNSEDSIDDVELEQPISRKPGHQPLSSEIKKLVTDFYEDDMNSRQLAGMRDIKSVKKADGTREKVQKRLVLSNLRELYTSFKKEYPTVQLQFSKFATLRPQHCVIAGSSGTHTVCVCTTHQNVKLMLEGCKFSTLIKDSDWIEESHPIYSNLLKKLLCDDPTESCYDRSCEKCPDSDEMTQFFQELFDDRDIDKVQYKKWTATDRCTIIDVISEADEFIESLVEQLELLLKHDYIAKTQSRYCANLKKELKKGDFIVTLDFAENYTFVVQEAVQAFHYNNDQATLLPMVIYYHENDKTEHCSFVGITDCLKHDFVSVHLFQVKLIAFLKEKFVKVNKIHYFSDGAPQQFKNRNAFTNLCYHKDDFSIEAEWNFFATAHGKGPCDGLAGSVKRLARKASLQMGTQSQILTPRDLFQWASKALPNIRFVFIENIEYLNSKAKLDNRSSQSKTVKGTQSLHSFSPIPNNLDSAAIKLVSTSSTFSIIQVFRP